MTPRLYKSVTQGTLYFLLLGIFAVAAYSGILRYTFWIDDWTYLWLAYYQPAVLLRSWLHFGTSLEFVVLSRIFGNEPFLWQLFGILLRVIASYTVSLMVRVVTRSGRAGMIAGICYVFFAAGLQGVHWPSAHVAQLDVILLCIGIFAAVSYGKAGKSGDLLIAVTAFTLVLVLDFVRVLPLVIIIALLVLPAKAVKRHGIVRKILTGMFLFLLVAAPLIFYKIQPVIVGSVLYRAVTNYHFSWAFIQKLFYYSANLFGSLWNMIAGWAFLSVGDTGSGILHPIFALVTFLILASVISVSLYRAVIRKDPAWRAVLLFVVWMFIFYIPQWIFEPRITVDVPHRYLIIPGVGFIALLSFGISRITNKFVRIVLVSAFVLMNIFTVRSIIARDLPFRSQNTNSIVLSAIHAAVQPGSRRPIFIFFGEDPVKVNVLDLSGSAHFALIRGLRTPDRVPVVTSDMQLVEEMVCGHGPDLPGNTRFSRLSDVYSWEVTNTGAVTDLSRIMRKDIQDRCGIEKKF